MPITTRRRAAVSLVIALAVTIVTVPAGTSYADIPNYRFVSGTSDRDSRDKGAEATCPSGTRVLGGGAVIDGASGDVIVDEVIPTVNEVSVYGVEKTGDAAEAYWTITAWAVCGTPSGLVHTRSLETGPGPNAKDLTVTCEPGEFLLGTGYELEGARGGASVETLVPTLNSVRATAKERDRGYASDWSLRVFAICAEDPPAGLWLYSKTSRSNSDDKMAEVSCGGAGDRQVVLGTGYAISGGAGEVVIDELVAAGDTVLGWAAKMDGSTRDWTVTAYAICAYER
ncbi:hypothetical protein [Microbispora sp. NPDC049125]|uniref:hypothetical protein n=1 Tax=Microbispora sp. NPDC049125 TaxID=3154929 RepID=UPI003466FF75